MRLLAWMLIVVAALTAACARLGEVSPAAGPSVSVPVPGPTGPSPSSGAFEYTLEPVGETRATTPDGAVYEAALRHEMFPPVEFAIDPPKILFILDRLCTGAGRGTGVGQCDEPIDPVVAADLTRALSDVVVVEFVPEEQKPIGPSWMVQLSPTKIEGQTATVGFAHTDDPLCAHGTLAKLERRDGTWAVSGGSGVSGCA